MKHILPLLIALFAAPLHSSPIAETLQLAGLVELSREKLELMVDVEFRAEKTHTIQYVGVARVTDESGKVSERPVTLYVGKSLNKPRTIISILMSGVAFEEGLYLEMVAATTPSRLILGDLVMADTELMWMIRHPLRDITETTYLTRDRGEARLELVGIQ